MIFKLTWIKKLALLLVIGVVCLLAVEGVARLVLGTDYPMNRDDPETVTQRYLNQTVGTFLFQRDPDERVCYELKPGGKTKILD
ncbi:MAG: hypothetical protein ABIK28_11525, partial [Planctomycetota bacterium]